MKAVVTFFVFALAATAHADPDEGKVSRQFLVHQSQTAVAVDINQSSVLCLAADYSAPVLKILVPALSQLTLLNHQNTGAGAPCLTTNESCLARPGQTRASPEDIIQGRPGRDTVVVTVRELRNEELDASNGLCHVSLIEQVTAQIRGKNFSHQRVAELTDRPLSDCQR